MNNSGQPELFMTSIHLTATFSPRPGSFGSFDDFGLQGPPEGSIADQNRNLGPKSARQNVRTKSFLDFAFTWLDSMNNPG